MRFTCFWIVSVLGISGWWWWFGSAFFFTRGEFTAATHYKTRLSLFVHWRMEIDCGWFMRCDYVAETPPLGLLFIINFTNWIPYGNGGVSIGAKPTEPANRRLCNPSSSSNGFRIQNHTDGGDGDNPIICRFGTPSQIFIAGDIFEMAAIFSTFGNIVSIAFHIFMAFSAWLSRCRNARPDNSVHKNNNIVM